MLSSLTTFALDGVTTQRVTVEVDVRPGLPAFTIVGLGDRAVREARERVKAAIQNGGWSFPQQRVTVNLAPADLRKEGPGFDLAIAVGILLSIGVVRPDAADQIAIFGELELSGRLRGCRGALAVAEGALAAGLGSIIVPSSQLAEAALAGRLAIFGAADLREVVSILAGESAGQPVPAPTPGSAAHLPDLADVRGHAGPIRALTIAAAGGHHVLMTGPPGTGKSMLARRLPGLLPEMTDAERLEVLRIRSVTGQPVRGDSPRPFRSPHHSISSAGLVGGGVTPMPGEMTLAHRGVLFLDELAEFSRGTLEAMRQPLEDGELTVVRGQRAVTYPAAVQLVAATNPCPCGHHPGNRCRCNQLEVERYRRRISGPLLDRIDLAVEVQAPCAEELQAPPVTTSAQVRELVAVARLRQQQRSKQTETPIWNSQLASADLRALPLEARAEAMLRRAYLSGMLSPRGRDRVLRLSRTIADLAERDEIVANDVLEALAARDIRIDVEQVA